METTENTTWLADQPCLDGLAENQQTENSMSERKLQSFGKGIPYWRHKEGSAGGACSV